MEKKYHSYNYFKVIKLQLHNQYKWLQEKLKSIKLLLYLLICILIKIGNNFNKKKYFLSLKLVSIYIHNESSKGW